MLTKERVRNTDQMLAYITECNLATIEHMALLKSRSKGEYERQISIAQTAVDWILQNNIDYTGTRIVNVVQNAGGSVKDWAYEMDVLATSL